MRKYKAVLEWYENKSLMLAEILNDEIKELTPTFITPEYCDQMKRRLYTKDPIYYKQFESYGTSNVNWYYVDGEWKYYKYGKQINIK